MEEKSKILSPADLIVKLDKIKARKLKEAVYFVEELGGNIIIKEPTFETIKDSSEMNKDEADSYLVSQCIIQPELRNSELMAKFGAANPSELVKVLFKPQTITHLALSVISLGHFDGSGVKKVEEVKN